MGPAGMSDLDMVGGRGSVFRLCGSWLGGEGTRWAPGWWGPAYQVFHVFTHCGMPAGDPKGIGYCSYVSGDRNGVVINYDNSFILLFGYDPQQLLDFGRGVGAHCRDRRYRLVAASGIDDHFVARSARPYRVAFRNPRLTFWVAATASCVTILDLFHSPLYALTWVSAVNRAFALMVIWVTALLWLRRQRDEAGCCGSMGHRAAGTGNALPDLPSIKNSKSCGPKRCLNWWHREIVRRRHHRDDLDRNDSEVGTAALNGLWIQRRGVWGGRSPCSVRRTDWMKCR